MRIAFLGLGNMGAPMARNLIAGGHSLRVWNRTASRSKEMAGAGGETAADPAAAVSDAELVITMLADDAAVEEVVWGNEERNGFLDALPDGAIHVSMSTISTALSRRLAAAHGERSGSFVAAPVFGRPDAAKAKKLWIVAGGSAGDVARCGPAFEAMGQGTFHVGEAPEAANVVKLAGNFMIASMIEMLGESFALVAKAGIERERFLEIVTSLFRSPILENYGGMIVRESFDPGFRLKLGLKDVRLALAVADEHAVPMPLASMLHDHFLSGVAAGKGDLDWSALARIAAERAGL
ncbi:MAG: NAD(P)-dependent oxidoreductase [Thermoanaerobaculia bacterium]